MDQKTENGDIVEFVRVCIVIDASKPIPGIVQVKFTDEGEIVIVTRGVCGKHAIMMFQMWSLLT